MSENPYDIADDIAQIPDDMTNIDEIADALQSGELQATPEDMQTISEAAMADLALEVDRVFNPVDPATFTFDPYSPTIVGEPVTDSEFYLYQGTVGTCTPTAVAMMLADVLNIPLESNEAVVQRAVDEGIITYDPTTEMQFSGMTTEQTIALCELYGLEVESQKGTLEDLQNSLAAGESIIVGVDGHEIATGDDDATDLGLEDNHSLLVTGIDEPAGVVYLNNPNDPAGTIIIPLDQFRDAWADSGNDMITTVLPEDQAALNLDPAALADLTPLDPAKGPGEPLLVPAGTEAAPDSATTPLLTDEAFAQRGERNVLLPFTFLVQSADRIS